MSETITVRVRFFASFREQFGLSDETLSVANNTTIRQLFKLLLPDAEIPDRILVARNQEYSDLGQVISDGDEIAYFPPVTGG
ncbi:MAG: MoaD/ThiS family protein [Gammaproteobacteria bacterium]